MAGNSIRISWYIRRTRNRFWYFTPIVNQKEIEMALFIKGICTFIYWYACNVLYRILASHRAITVAGKHQNNIKHTCRPEVINRSVKLYSYVC